MTDCTHCLDYLHRRRTVLLPYIGRHVVQTGKPPAHLVKKITDRYHHLDHPTPAIVIPPTSEATKALRRLATQKRANP